MLRIEMVVPLPMMVAILAGAVVVSFVIAFLVSQAISRGVGQMADVADRTQAAIFALKQGIA